MKRLADACVKLLLNVQRHGPFFLGGYSFGSLVAIEIATTLQNMGENVALLAMIDTLLWLPDAAYNSKSLIGLSIKQPLQDGIYVSVLFPFLFNSLYSLNQYRSKVFDRFLLV